MRAIELRGQPHLSFVYSHERRDITKNLPLAEGLQELRALIGPQFANAHLHTHDEELQLAHSRKGRFSLRARRARARRAHSSERKGAGHASDSARQDDEAGAPGTTATSYA